MFLQLVANGLVTGAVLAIAAVGVSLIYGILGLVNFAYGDVMTFGAFVAVLCNDRGGMGMVVAAALAMVATAILSLSLEGALWRPLRARRAGFMSLFLASIGLALVIRQAIFLVAGPQPRSYDVDPYKVYVVGSVRLSGAPGSRRHGRRSGDRRWWRSCSERRRSDERCAPSPTTARSRRWQASTRGA